MEIQQSLFASPPDPDPNPGTYDQIPFKASISIPPGTYQTLDHLKDHCHLCQRCGLSTGRTHTVVSRGNPAARLMIIGEAPGENEDLQGLPFVGKSGQLLDKILESVGFNPATDTYICNAIKCRPPENRIPTAEEMEACHPYLLEQIRMVDPKIILLSGSTAVRALLKDKRGITKIRGEWILWENRWVMPIFHPAYLLRNPSRNPGSPKWQMWQDIQEVRRKFEELS
jgi:DNA polymerase